MDTNRFQIRIEKDVDPIQYGILDTIDNAVKVRYADKAKAEQVCKDLNANIK